MEYSHVSQKRRDMGHPSCDLSCLCNLRTHLFHELAHGGDMPWRAGFTPGLVALRGFLQVCEIAIHFETFPRLRDGGLRELPDPEELATGLKEEVFMQQAVVKQRAGLLPITEHHHRVRAIFGSRRGDSHRVVEILHEVILEEPIPCLAKSGFAALFIDLKMELCLFVSRFCRQDHSSPFIWCLMN